MNIYFDVCCLNRPFDDSSQLRVATESAAVISLLELIDSSVLTDYSSEMARIEIERMLDPDRRRKGVSLLPPKARIMKLNDEVLDRSEELVQIGFPLADAVHLAAAEYLGVDAFLTVDDRLLRRARRVVGRLAIRVVDPVIFLEEFSDANDR